MPKMRLDHALFGRGLVASRSQAESWIKLGKVFVNGRAVTKPGHFVSAEDKVELKAAEQYVNRAALKLASVAEALKLDFKGKTVLDVGSSTGGFTDYALKHGAKKVIAVEAGTDQLHPSLRGNPNIELHEQTDIREVRGGSPRGSTPLARRNEHEGGADGLTGPRIDVPDIVLVDVSFVSLRDILPHVATLASKKTQIVAMVKPQFEAEKSNLKHKGVIKNDRVRRDILKSFEDWAHEHFVSYGKADSQVAGAKGNLERFYKFQKL